jgi:hypothetical protein
LDNKIRVPTFDEMMQPVLEVLQQLGKEASLKQLREDVAQFLNLSSEQISVRHNSNSIKDKRSKYEYNLAWTLTYLKSAGYLQNRARGIWSLSELGRQTEALNIEQVKKEVRTYKSGSTGELVTVPNPQDEGEEADIEEPEEIEITTPHTEIQWLLLKLGSEMGLQVWVANNDRSKQYDGVRFDSLPKLLRKLPQRFDEATQRTVELIDVLWLDGQAILAAFEIENSTSIYSGLLRMSDLTAMQPDIRIPLYIVAPDERERKVRIEINRPTFSKATNLADRCRYISYSALRAAIERAEGIASHLAPSFIEAFSQRVNSDLQS